MVRWNNIEDKLRRLLVTVSGSPDVAIILAGFLGNVGLTDSLETTVNSRPPALLRAHVLHAIRLTNTLREYRNYYVHNSKAIVTDYPAPSLGLLLYQTTTKKSVNFLEEVLCDEQMIRVLNWMWELESYLYAILVCYWRYDENPIDAYQPPSWLQMPLQPDRLKKPPLFDQFDFLQHGSSPG